VQRIAAQDGQITRMAGDLAALTEANEALAGKLAASGVFAVAELRESAVERRSAGPDPRVPSLLTGDAVTCVFLVDTLGEVGARA